MTTDRSNRKSLGTATIAVVDDDNSVRPAVARLLRGSGYAVQEYRSGAALLRSLAHSVPDCIVLDLHMPDMSGLDVDSALAEGGFCLPIVMLTADPETCARECPHLPCLAKPVDSTVLLDAIDAALQDRAIRLA